MQAASKETAHIVVSFKEGKHKCVRAPCLVTEAFPESNHVLAHTFNPSGGEISLTRIMLSTPLLYTVIPLLYYYTNNLS